MQFLRHSYGSACLGNLALVLVEGTSGIGKTALVERFLDQITASADPFRKPVILRSRCHERETLPFKAFDGIVDALSSRLANLGTGELAQGLPAGAVYLSEIFPVLYRLDQLEHARDFCPRCTMRPSCATGPLPAFRELLGRLAQRQPVVAFIDDLQWADRDSFALLQALLGQPQRAGPVAGGHLPADPAGCAGGLVARDRGPSRGEKHGGGPLSPEAASALVDRLADSGEIDQPVKQRLAEAVVQEAGGNPLFTLELMRYLCDVVLPRAGRRTSARDCQ
jgi:hypothetical protein